MKNFSLALKCFLLKSGLKPILTISLMCISILVLSGCFLFGSKTGDNFNGKDVDTDTHTEQQSAESDAGNIEEDKANDLEEITEEELTENGENSYENLVATNISINVYYVDEQAQYLVGESRNISGIYKEDFIISAFNELIKDPVQKNIYNVIPEGTKIIGAEYKDNYATLNLSQEFIRSESSNGLLDVLIVNCIAATITEIPDVDGVLFKINGENISMYGSLDVSNPIGKNYKLIK